MTALSPYWINVAGDIAFDYADPNVAMISPTGIMHHLAMIPRWGGNVQFPYSVLQHSLIVAEAMQDPAERIYGFIHDWPEALLGGDHPTPYKAWLKTQGADINALEGRIMAVVLNALGLPVPSEAVLARVHLADQQALATEFRDVVQGKTDHWAPSAIPLPQTIRFRQWDKVLEDASEMLGAYLYLAREAA